MKPENYISVIGASSRMDMTTLKWHRGVLLSLIVWVATPIAIGQERVTEPFTAQSLRAAADYLKERNGHALVVYHRDKLVFEEYFNGWSADKPHRLASGTKSFSGAMLAAVIHHSVACIGCGPVCRNRAI